MEKTLKIFERDGICWMNGDNATRHKYNRPYEQNIEFSEFCIGTTDEKSPTNYTPEQFHAKFGESKPLGLSLDPKDYEGRKLDRVKDAFACPEGVAIPLVRWDHGDNLVHIVTLNGFDAGYTVWDNYATIPGYEIPDEWRTYKEPAAPAKPRQMTRGEALRAQMTGALEIVSGEMHTSGIFLCTDDNRDDPMGDVCRCRKWGDSEWQPLTIDMLPEAWGVK